MQKYIIIFAKYACLYISLRSLFKRSWKPEWRSAFALGLFVAEYKWILDKMKQQNAFEERTQHALASYVASYQMFSLDRSMCSPKIATFLCLRAIQRPFQLFEPAYFTLQYLPTIFMCLSGAKIISSWLSGDYIHLDASYRSFLDAHGNIPRRNLKVLRTEQVKCAELCKYLHPYTSSCGRHAVNFFVKEYVQSMKLYSTIYLPLMLIRIYRRNSDWKKTIKSTMINMLRSSLFLTLYCVSGTAALCVLSNTSHKNEILTKWKIAKYVWVIGLTTFLETRRRQTELAFYCSTYALDTLHKQLDPKRRLFHPVLVSLSISLLAFFHDTTWPQYLENDLL